MISSLMVLFLFLLLFVLGFISLIFSKNIIFIFISLEIMINAISYSLICLGDIWNNLDGQIMYILLITISAIELSISLLLLIQFYSNKKILKIDKLIETF